jgi:hypothetical protein
MRNCKFVFPNLVGAKSFQTQENAGATCASSRLGWQTRSDCAIVSKTPFTPFQTGNTIAIIVFFLLNDVNSPNVLLEFFDNVSPQNYLQTD